MNEIDNCPKDLQLVATAFLEEINQLFSSAGFEAPANKIPFLEFNSNLVIIEDPDRGKRPFDLQRDYGHLEALGMYFPDHQNVAQEQKFVLYHESLRAVAGKLNSDFSPNNIPDDDRDEDYKTCLRKLMALVLCHEIAHWFIHQSSNQSGLPCQKLYYKTKDSIFFHEGMAQYLLNQALDKMELAMPATWATVPHFKTIMTWMEAGQPVEYNAYVRFDKDPAKVMKAFSMIHPTNIQSFELMEQAIHQLQKTTTPEWNKVIHGFMHTPFTKEFSSESMHAVQNYLRNNHPELEQQYSAIIAANRYGV